MMTNAIRKPEQPNLEQERAALAEHERELAAVHRRLNATRPQVSEYRAAGDQARLEQSRREIRSLTKRSDELNEEIAEDREAIDAAASRDRRASSANSFTEIHKVVVAARQSIEACEAALNEFAAKYLATRLASDTADNVMRLAGIDPDPLLLRAKISSYVEISLHVETGGLLGRPHPRESDHQVKRSGAASLKRQAAEYYAVTMRQVSNKLGVNP